MHVAEIWRYPVKSMGGERLEQATLGPLGIEGDRVVHVEDARGHVVTARTHPRLLGHHGVLDDSGEPRVDGAPWNDARISEVVADIVGPRARLVRDESPSRFDILPLLVATDGAIAAFGHDSRRLRPNIVIGGVEGLAERTWQGGRLRIGYVVIGIEDLRGRCVMTTFDPDTQEQDVRVLKEIARRFDGTLALNCYVIRGGTIRVGERAEIALPQTVQR
jgi:hypothetical protein